MKTLRLILGDQLNIQHSWFSQVDPDVTYVMMEIRAETDYVLHHAQKIIAIFAAMRAFKEKLISLGHQVIYYQIDNPDNQHDFEKNIRSLISQLGITRLEMQYPDEVRVDEVFHNMAASLPVETNIVDSEHFITQRDEATKFFGTRKWLMESFYRHLRNKHQVLMANDKPVGGAWNFDKENRKAWRGKPPAPEDWRDTHDHHALWQSIQAQGVNSFGEASADDFRWPLNRDEALQQLDYFLNHILMHFGDYQDAMSKHQSRMFHALISFSLNVKLISPMEVISRTEQIWKEQSLPLPAVEGFIRQILGWREYIRGYYWRHAKQLQQVNFFQHQQPLPKWFWTGNTKMACLNNCIQDSLKNAYAHHIQRLMVIGNFGLLAGINPQSLHEWYLGIYIDAFEWVEMPNTLGMSQFADGGMLASKPYVSSANYIDKMSDYCQGCHYHKNLKISDSDQAACPFNSLYWNFYMRHADKLQKNVRLSIVYQQIRKMDDAQKNSIQYQAQIYLNNLENL